MPRYLPTLVVSILIIIAVLIPGSNIPDVNIIGLDKIVHVCMFATLAVAVRYDLAHHYKFARVLSGGLFFSLLTEVLQLLVEGRSFDVYDIAADGVGLILGLLIAPKLFKLLGR